MQLNIYDCVFVNEDLDEGSGHENEEEVIHLTILGEIQEINDYF